MSNQYNNKVVLSNGTTLIDLTGDTVTAADVSVGVTFHLRSGEQTTGALANGDSLEYGLTDGTLPIVGVAQAGYAEI